MQYSHFSAIVTTAKDRRTFVTSQSDGVALLAVINCTILLKISEDRLTENVINSLLFAILFVQVL